jgi:hypothetical protein
MSLPQTLYESPSGLVHLAGLLKATSYSPKRAITRCGREVNLETWSRIPMLDEWMFGKGLRVIADKIELPKCDRCFE